MEERKIHYFVRYSEHQYLNGSLVILGSMPYEIFDDTISERIFSINQNNEIVYLDRIDSECLLSVYQKAYVLNCYKNNDCIRKILDFN